MSRTRQTITPKSFVKLEPGSELVLNFAQFDARRHALELLRHRLAGDEYHVRVRVETGFKAGDTFTQIEG